MVVAICDDDRVWETKAVHIIEEYAKKTFLELGTFSFLGREELAAYSGEAIDLLFLSVDLSGGDVIQVAQEISRKWKGCQIVYVTDHLYYEAKVYATEHVLFVTKADFQRRIEEIFVKCIYNRHLALENLVFHVIKGMEIVLDPDDICYFERVKRVTIIGTVRGQYQIWDKLDDIMPKLSTIDFVRCHNSYIVHFPYVYVLQKERFILKSGEEINISRSRSKAVHQAFMRWALTQMT